MRVNVWMSPDLSADIQSLVETEIKSVLIDGFEVRTTDSVTTADVLVGDADTIENKIKGTRNLHYFIVQNPHDPADLAKQIRSAQFLPSMAGVMHFEEIYNRDLDRLRAIKKSSPDDSHPDPSLTSFSEAIDPDFDYSDFGTLAVKRLRGSVLGAKMPDLSKILHGRFCRQLQRHTPGWSAVRPFAEESAELYPQPLSAEELRDNTDPILNDLFSSQPIESLMDYSQLNLGLPHMGSVVRKAMGVRLPDDELSSLMGFVAQLRIRGLAKRLSAMEKEEAKKVSVRVGVKVANYQGGIGNTTSHSFRNQIWAYMLAHPKQVFAFEDVGVPHISGFRKSSNGVGKKRPSYVLQGNGIVVKSRAIDGEELKNKKMPAYSSSGHSPVGTFPDPGVKGGRLRFVSNMWSGSNDQLAAVPAYIGSCKDAYYVGLWHQDVEILSRFVSLSHDTTGVANEWWTHAAQHSDFIQLCAKYNPAISAMLRKHGEGSNFVDAFIDLCDAVGERVVAGDVVSYEAAATWDFVLPYFRKLLHPRALAVADRSYNADKLGVYANSNGDPVYYYISSEVEPDMTTEEKEMVEQTREVFGSLPSGFILTSEAGRGPMTAVNMHMMVRTLVKLGLSSEDAHLAVRMMPQEMLSNGKMAFSPFAAFCNNGGDDHILATLVLHLLSGKSIEEDVIPALEGVITSYDFLRVEIEQPPMTCGYLFHFGSSDSRTIGVSLSGARMKANNLGPERPKSAMGTDGSISNYLDSMDHLHDDLTEYRTDAVVAADAIVRSLGWSSLEEVRSVSTFEKNLDVSHESAYDIASKLLGVPVSNLHYEYSYGELVEMGLDEELLDQLRRPMPSALSADPYRFFNEDTLLEASKLEVFGAKDLLITGESRVAVPAGVERDVAAVDDNDISSDESTEA